MSKLGAASALAACLPIGAMRRILDIWEAQESCRVELEFKDGRCLEIRVTRAARFGSDDFVTEPLDKPVTKP